jgi:hypothetical protein
MKKIVRLICLCAVFGQPVLTWSQDRGGDVRLRVIDERGNPQKDETLIYDHSYALLIGNAQYKDRAWPDLPDVDEDITAVKEVLEKQHGFKVEVALNLNRDSLLRVIDQFISKYGQRYNNRLLIYYSGHGYTALLADERRMGYLVMPNAPAMPDVEKALRTPPTDEEFERFLPAAITMDEIETYARRITAKHVLFVFDSCFSGTVLYKDSGTTVPPRITTEELKPVREYLTAGNETQRVPAYSKFRRKFVAGLAGQADENGDGIIFGSELGRWVGVEVERDTGRTQTPVFGKSDLFKRGDMVFVVPRLTPPTSAGSPPPGTIAPEATPVFGNTILQGEVSFNYAVNKTLAIGNGEYEIKTSWSERSEDCVWAYNYYNDGVANAKAKNFESILDVTAYDMSSRAKVICANEVAVFKNRSGYYAMVQVLKVSRSQDLLSIRYKIIPTKLLSTWRKPDYSSKAKVGEVTFEFNKNNGKFRIGEDDFAFDTEWSRCNSE